MRYDLVAVSQHLPIAQPTFLLRLRFRRALQPNEDAAIQHGVRQPTDAGNGDRAVAAKLDYRVAFAVWCRLRPLYAARARVPGVEHVPQAMIVPAERVQLVDAEAHALAGNEPEHRRGRDVVGQLGRERP